MAKVNITKDSFAFLRSVRFWKLAIVAVLISMQGQGYIDDGILKTAVDAIELLLGGSVVISTVDRATEKLGSK